MALTLAELQDLIRRIYGAKDQRRGVEGTFMWFMEEVGELSAALRNGNHRERLLEFADVLAWLVTLANTVGVDLEAAIAAKYGAGCPGCRQSPCICDLAAKP
ncbi:MAG: nucleotide pyrophosphohydrolase [Gemmataceae bacterium]|nr:nucleotide pyrophosphohydrolase [Gemmataceae bacterium]MDW8265634.1 MazG nucleotide pyrophosphohydrolase domain-containing protein [Gemmataceae bacterium]